MTAAAFIAMVVSAFMTLAVMMSALMTLALMMTVVVALGIGIIFQRAFSQCLCGGISRSLNAGIELYPCISKRHLRAHADPSADQGIGLHRLQETCKSSVSVSVGINDLFVNYLAVFDIVQLDLFGVAEMLEDFSAFVCDCYSHSVDSFLNDLLIENDRFKFTVSACDQQPFPVYKGVSDLFPCAVIDGSYRGPGYVHPGCTGLLCKTFVIQKSQCLKFVYGHLNAFCGCGIIG